MKTLLMFAGVGLLCLAVVWAAQDKRAGDAGQVIERKYDRFKDETTVKLKPQRILDSKAPRQVLELSAKATFKGEQPTQWNEMVEMLFTSSAEKSPYYDAAELGFIVDGERVKATSASVGKSYNPEAPLAPDLKVAKDIAAFISLDTLRKIGSGKVVEMKLGSTELVLDAITLSNLRQFATAVFNK